MHAFDRIFLRLSRWRISLGLQRARRVFLLLLLDTSRLHDTCVRVHLGRRCSGRGCIVEWSERGCGGGKKAGRLGGEGEDDGAAHAARQTKNDEPRWGPDGGQKHATGPKPRPLLCRLPCYVYTPPCV